VGPRIRITANVDLIARRHDSVAFLGIQ